MADVWANSVACHPSTTCHIAWCCHLANLMSWFQSYVSHCRVMPKIVTAALKAKTKAWLRRLHYWISVLKTCILALFNCFTESSFRMRVVNHNWSDMKQRLHLQSVADISRHSVLSGDRIRQCETLSGSIFTEYTSVIDWRETNGQTPYHSIGHTYA